MKEAPTKKSAETNGNEFKRFELDEFKIRLMEESGRAQDMSQKYVNQLFQKISDLQVKLADIIEEKEKTEKIIAKLQKESEKVVEDARAKHEETTTAIINSFGLKPPWDAKFEKDQNNKLVAVLVKPLSQR
jgi:1,2-phenylacetyl-CoA epoxidase catalytic subunit